MKFKSELLAWPLKTDPMSELSHCDVDLEACIEGSVMLKSQICSAKNFHKGIQMAGKRFLVVFRLFSILSKATDVSLLKQTAAHAIRNPPPCCHLNTFLSSFRRS
ncbi:hypothetical protein AVEN_228621-1 [Araneus ventricosus]|uniref:Uncharacterized protein n=1 Tax=Araneus ventricosus TaxID=182803 RepID=A0A4Y2U8W8_ARAVE|nr:hypothetical protein AVEN_228621-1 [Araneus ventricosus]